MDTSIYGRRTNSTKLSLTTNSNLSSGNASDAISPASRTSAFPRRFGGDSASHGKSGLHSATTPGGSRIMSPGAGASSAFGLGSGAFSSFGTSAKTPKATSNPFDAGFRSASSTSTGGASLGGAPSAKSGAPAAHAAATAGAQPAAGPPNEPRYRLRHEWVFWYRPPISKANGYIEYEKTLHPMAAVSTVEDFFAVYAHLKRPSTLPVVSDYHLFRKNIRPIWEDAENRKGGKWIVRLKKGVADRYWEDLMLAIIGDQFGDASEEVCGAVLSVRNGEDILSVWARNDGGRVLKIRETMKRVLNMPADTKVEWKSHDTSIQQRTALEDSRREKPNHHYGHLHNNHNHNTHHNHHTHHQSDRRGGKASYPSRGGYDDQTSSFANP